MDTILTEAAGFTHKQPTVMLLDINSCFATIEQQANPMLRGKPVVVAAYATGKGCILAASREAKQYGVKTGMPVFEAQQRIPQVIVLTPDPDKYRYVNRKLVALLEKYTDPIEVKSIDEMVFRLDHSPHYRSYLLEGDTPAEAMRRIAVDIKARIATTLGSWISVSIGIAPNRYLAKIAASYQKPNGLVLIDKQTIVPLLETMRLEDLCYIKTATMARLARQGILTPVQLYAASIQQLCTAFSSVVGRHWWMRLHGWEIDDRPQVRKSIGHSYALPQKFTAHDERLLHILHQLVIKTGRRLRTLGYTARGIGVSVSFQHHPHWGHTQMMQFPIRLDRELYDHARSIVLQAPNFPVRILAIHTYALCRTIYSQPTLFDQEDRAARLTIALDAIAERFGDWKVVPGKLLTMPTKVHDRIAFGSSTSLTYSMRHIRVEA